MTAAAGGPETCLEFAIYIVKKNRQKYAGRSEVRKCPTYRSTFSELKKDDVLFSVLGKDNWSSSLAIRIPPQKEALILAEADAERILVGFCRRRREIRG